MFRKGLVKEAFSSSVCIIKTREALKCVTISLLPNSFRINSFVFFLKVVVSELLSKFSGPRSFLQRIQEHSSWTSDRREPMVEQ